MVESNKYAPAMGELRELLNNYPDIPLNLAGFPQAWDTSLICK